MAGDQPNGEQRDAQGVALTGSVVYDTDLYAGSDRSAYTSSIGVGEDDDQDEREQALAKCAPYRHVSAHLQVWQNVAGDALRLKLPS